MTPPDSGEVRHECRCGQRIVGRDAEGSHTWSECKPDSGEREVCGKPFELLVCREPPGHAGKHWHVWVPTQDWTLIPLPLAQRILAALEDQVSHGGGFLPAGRIAALADELRAIVERKT